MFSIVQRELCNALGYNFPEHVSVTMDSRSASNGSIFFAIKGNRTDGRIYAKSASENGAYIVMDRKELPESIELPRERVIYVDDVRQKIIEIATRIRCAMQNNGAVVIGVTGSSGKTFTKSCIHKVISERIGPSFVTESSYNTEYGLFLSLCKVPDKIRYIILELGISKPGDMDIIGEIARPDIGLLLNVGLAHVGQFADRAALLKEKISIAKYIQPSGKFVLHQDLLEYMPSVSDVEIVPFNGSEIHCIPDKRSVLTKGQIVIQNKSYSISCIHIYGSHLLENITAVIAMFLDKLTVKDMIESLETIAPVKGRGTLYKNLVSRGMRFSIFDSSYNANPGLSGSMYRELEVMDMIVKSNADVILVLGEMRELGDYSASFHEEILSYALSITKSIILVGTGWSIDDNYPYWIKGPISEDNLDQVVEMIYGTLQEDSIVFFKGSNSIKLSLIVDRLLREADA